MFIKRSHTDKIIIHCSASPQGIGTTSENIQSWHVERGFKAIGYHLIVLENGITEIGRPLDVVGAHAQGHNESSIGLCFIGQGGDMTPAQELAILINIMACELEYGNITVLGHNNFTDKKTCPGFDVPKWHSEVQDKYIINKLKLGQKVDINV